jgi:hypothetical protein
LHPEDVPEIAIVPIGPDVASAHTVDQLSGDPNPSVGLPDAAFQDMSDAQIPRQQGHV